MNWEMAGVALSGIGLAGAAVVGIWSWMANRHHATSEQVDQMDHRVTVLEMRVDTLPTPESLSTYRSGMDARLASIEAFQKANYESLKRIEGERLRRIEDYLLNKDS